MRPAITLLLISGISSAAETSSGNAQRMIELVCAKRTCTEDDRSKLEPLALSARLVPIPEGTSIFVARGKPGTRSWKKCGVKTGQIADGSLEEILWACSRGEHVTTRENPRHKFLKSVPRLTEISIDGKRIGTQVGGMGKKGAWVECGLQYKDVIVRVGEQDAPTPMEVLAWITDACTKQGLAVERNGQRLELKPAQQ